MRLVVAFAATGFFFEIEGNLQRPYYGKYDSALTIAAILQASGAR